MQRSAYEPREVGLIGLRSPKLHIWAFERTKNVHLEGMNTGDTLRHCRLGICILGPNYAKVPNPP